MTVAQALRRIMNRCEAALKDPKYDEMLEDFEEIVEMLEDGASGEDIVDE